jgi:DNA-binding transcriptional LysR family regulator
VLLPWLESFQQRHTKLALRVYLSDRNTDPMRAPVDVAIRCGALADSTQVALPLAPDNVRVLVASPAYVARHGVPASAEELGRHEAAALHVARRGSQGGANSRPRRGR